MSSWTKTQPTQAAQPGIAADRFAHEIGAFLKVISAALAAAACQAVLGTSNHHGDTWSNIMKMRTAIALLVEDDLSNRLASFTLRCRDYGFNLNVLRLPAHVSLKQPFVVNDFERFEKYFEEFARQTEQQRLELNGFVFWGNEEYGVVVVRVAASPRLRQLHSQLNAELEQEFGETQADFDGDDYEFHLSVALGAFRAELLPQLEHDIVSWKMNEVTLSSRLAMFIYEESTRPDPLYGVREYGTYKILPLGQRSADP